MSPEEFRQIEEAFVRAIDLPAAGRAAIVAALPPPLRGELERLLAADAPTSATEEPTEPDPLARLIGSEAADWAEREGQPENDEEPADPWIGGQIGPWRIERRLGSGGMSTVYLAWRSDGDLPMGVALKRIQPGLRSRELLARFRQERRILAGLVHPHIARFLDGGTAPDGSPYFVLEWVDGEPIDRYADAQRLGIRARVELMRQVAEAVAAAHRRLVVHRDLKPSNILVTREGMPKLLDFGIAKLLRPDTEGPVSDASSALAEPTMPRHRLLTPSYASPEQLAGEAVTTATDVYSLGLVLYELLAGRRPFGSRGAGSGERAARRDAEPERPSTAVLQTGEPPADEIAARRGLAPRALSRALTGDLDTIVATCLRREPERRYASADRLAEDLQRFLSGLPIAARREAWLYRTGKLLRRHRWAAASLLVALVASAGFVTSLFVQSRRLAQERDASQIERQRAEAVADFLLDLFQDAPPGGGDGAARRVTAGDLADRGASEVAAHPADDPRIQATLLETVGRVYLQLGLYDRAKAPLEGSLALRRRSLPAGDPDVAESLNRLAILAAESGSYDRAVELFRQVLAARRKRFGSDTLIVAQSLNNLALALQDQGSFRAAEPVYEESLAIAARRVPARDPHLLDFRANRALLLHDLGDFPRAERELRAVLAAQTRGTDDPEIAIQERYLGLALMGEGDLDGAESILERIERRLVAGLGASHPESLRATGSLAELRFAQGRVAEAADLFRRNFELRTLRLGAAHPETILALAGWGRALGAQGSFAAAEAHLREAIRRGRANLPPHHPDRAHLLVGLEALLAREGRCAELPPLAREAGEIRRVAFRPGDPRIEEGERIASSCRPSGGVARTGR